MCRISPPFERTTDSCNQQKSLTMTILKKEANQYFFEFLNKFQDKWLGKNETAVIFPSADCLNYASLDEQ